MGGRIAAQYLLPLLTSQDADGLRWRIGVMLSDKQFDVEHALSMYAISFACMPAAGIYDESALAKCTTALRTCHIYLIGAVPRMTFVQV